MIHPICFPMHRSRVISFYEKTDLRVPAKLFAHPVIKPDVANIPYPLPSALETYHCAALGEDGVVWLGSSTTGLTRYAPNEPRKADVIQYFSAERDLVDNHVRALLADGHNVWVETENGVSFIEMRLMSMEEKAAMLTKETLIGIDRHGMISHRALMRDNDITSRVPYGHCDNDGGFTAEFAIGEMMRYDVMAREKGPDSPEAQDAKRVALRAFEAALLLMYISGRGDGFVARSYITTSEILPDDGLFYRKEGDYAVCVETRASKRKNMVGKKIDASTPVPDRLAELYRSEGFSDSDIIYKGDTSSDEITAHFAAMYFAHKILGPDDPELDDLIQRATRSTMQHIVEHGFELWECDGAPTTWAKWSPRYFATPEGYVDACLNSAEVLMYLKVTMAILGETGIWQKAYDELLSYGYADLPAKHYDRLYQACCLQHIEPVEDIMYGDHALATYAFWLLIDLEADPVLKQKYRDGFMSWRTSIGREHNPFSDFIYLLTCPEAQIDMDWLAEWFLRASTSRISRSVTLCGRRDVPVRILRGGSKETDWLLPPDERFISKFDRNFYTYTNQDSGGKREVDSCYFYTLPYWMGRYYGYIAPENETQA